MRLSASTSVARRRGWVRRFPVTLQAYFRGAEGVTLEGAPQLTSTGIFTSELSREPRQATEMVGGEPVLVATWTGTVTPSSAGPLALVGGAAGADSLPRGGARASSMPNPFGDDPFAALGGQSVRHVRHQRFFQQSMQQSMAPRARSTGGGLAASDGAPHRRAGRSPRPTSPSRSRARSESST